MGKRKSKFVGVLRGINLRGSQGVQIIDSGHFAYRRKVFRLDDFPDSVTTINLDKINVKPVGKMVNRKKGKRKGGRKGGIIWYTSVKANHQTETKGVKCAVLYHNIDSCPDVQRIFHGQGKDR